MSEINVDLEIPSGLYSNEELAKIFKIIETKMSKNLLEKYYMKVVVKLEKKYLKKYLKNI